MLRYDALQKKNLPVHKNPAKLASTERRDKRAADCF
jgi:hypothetical protein